MYLISKLSKPTVQWVGVMSSTGAPRSAGFAIAVAYSLANKLALPSAPVKDLGQFFRMQYKNDVLATLDQINSLLPFDTKMARDLTQSFYAYRYNQAYPRPLPLAFKPETAIEDFFGLTALFGEAILAELKAKPAEITQMINNVQRLLAELVPTPVERSADEQPAPDQFLFAANA